MPNDDPFSSPQSDDRTIIRPVPGGRRSDIRRPEASHAQPSASSHPAPRQSYLNPLENAASGLLTLLIQLGSARSHPDPGSLKQQITEAIQAFQAEAGTQGVDPGTINTTRYVLCTALDEAVLNTPWGQNSDWAQHSLLSSFHQEVSGGERFFQLLKSLGEDPAKNLHLLELMYLCLALGFEGRYRIMPGGKDQLVRIREWLYQLIQQYKGSSERTLSPHWQGVTDKRNPLMRYIPIWVFAAITFGLLAALFSGFLVRLNYLSDPVFNQLYGIQLPRIEAVTPPTYVAEDQELSLSILLADEIHSNQLKIDEQIQLSMITVQGDGLFESGRVRIKPSTTALIERIGESLDQLPGEILVIGHSDNIPIRTARFPSNWDLSKARAEAVAAVIQIKLRDPTRIHTDARADTEPVASNKTPKGRSNNRRVEIILIK